jgi:quercetin dioxygenase-like cupin family protein
MMEHGWKKKNFVKIIVAILILSSLLLVARTVTATPPSGLTAEPIASGVMPHVIRATLRGGHDDAKVNTNVKNISLVKYTLDPGGSFGWHRHGGPVWVVVASGTLSIYAAEDPTCTPVQYAAGSAFLDPGNHTHLGANETDAPVVVYATFMLPAGGVPRIDAPDPEVCN